MEINTNLSNAVAASISKLNLNTSQRNIETPKPEKKPQKEESTEEFRELNIEPPVQKSPIDVQDVQKYAKYMGENLSIDDINYGLMYGRSIIADYSV